MKSTTNTCNSFDCSDRGHYCQQCSHATFFGEGTDRNGKLWRWEFNQWFGPLFVLKDGKHFKKQPEAEDHPAWEPFERWLEEE